MKTEPVNPLHLANAAPRCSAKSKRSGKACRSPAVRGKRVCRMHGAKAGAPTGVANGRYRHGQFTCEAVNRRAAVAALIRLARASAADL
ncbi:HGGxSTG domain-containing protein [Mesorhizobium sp. VNQ89]|uniref:HGGxSTG domain-containing protein n=1 Tax=Mesorhizobium quangtriensis TaxID=3157709 RepID=UPI0032B782EA